MIEDAPRLGNPLLTIGRHICCVLAAALLAGAASAGAAFVSVAELADRLDDPALVLLHVGHGPLGYERGHVPGARYVPHDLAMTEEPGRTNGLADDEAVLGLARSLGIDADSEVVLCGDANGVFPAPLWLLLTRLGVEARMLDGHLRGWEDAGLAVTTAVPAEATPSTYEPPAELLVVEATPEEAQAPGVKLVDVRPAREFAGEKPGHSVTRAGHAPGAVSLPWIDCFLGNRPPLLADLDVLRDRLAAAGVMTGDDVIVYDGIGTHAALGHAILTELGFERVRVLRGGFAGWDAAGLPVE